MLKLKKEKKSNLKQTKSYDSFNYNTCKIL